MKITIEERPELLETEVVIRCRETGPQIKKMMAVLQAFDRKLTGLRDGQTFLLDAEEVLYIDTADKKTFLYTADSVYETPLRLYELEERLEPWGFFRATKASIVNFDAIRSLRPDFGGRLLATMTNGEQMVISRQYVAFIKQKLGI